jgi:ribonuclease HI
MNKWYADGSGWSGKRCGWAVVCPDGSKHVDMSSTEHFTNNECEYKAVICAALFASPGDRIYTDSRLVVKQVSGEYKCKVQRLQILLQETARIIISKHLLLKWIPRKQNKAGRLFK